MKSTMKKHKLISILGILAILFTISPASAFAAEPMEDISGHWAKDQIQDWVDSGYIKGYPDGTFRPDNNITRAEFMTIVNNAFGYTEKAEINYSDVADGKWYTEAVAVAKAAGYIKGYPDGTMKPNAQITRQEAAVMISKIDELEADEAAADVFTDGKNIPAWSKGSIGACVTAGILTGYPDDSFLGGNNIKRGESVAALAKALSYKNAPDEIAIAVYGISTEGFHLAFSPAVDGLTQSAVTLTQGDANVTVSAITTEDNGITYEAAANLAVAQTYELTLAIEGYDFGDAVEFTVPTDQEAADEVNEAISALPATEELTLEDKDEVAGIKVAFDAMTTGQAALVTDDNKAKLDAAIAKIERLLTAPAETGGEQQDQNQ